MRNVSFVLVAALSLLSGCSSDKPAPKTPASGGGVDVALSPDQERAVADAQQNAGQGGLNFDDEVLRLCPGVKSPKFDYDSARVREAFRNSLVQLAQCMTDGGLKDKNLLLVGHADPRGEPDYNLALGGRRASSVQSAMASLGVNSSRFETSSRGDTEAKGTDEASWELDRRVDVKLAGRQG